MALNIKKAIASKGFTSKDISSILQISPVSFSTMINGNPTVDTLEKIANAIGCDISDLFDRTSDNTLHCPNCGAELELRKK